jgi:hypothetical protein
LAHRVMGGGRAPRHSVYNPAEIVNNGAHNSGVRGIGL